MSTLEDFVTATKILSEDPEKIMGVSNSKPKENRARVSDLSKYQVVNEQIVDSETVVESTLDGESALNRGFDGLEREKIGVRDLSNVSCGSQSVSEENRKDCEGFSANHGEIKYTGDELLMNDGENMFRVGDFVWGKIRSHSWWPGRVFDPKDASGFATKLNQHGNRVLVSFFGDGSCSWCLPSQLIPFAENFPEMSNVSNSKSFLNAVNRAVDEVSRVVELTMSCKCILQEKNDGLVRQAVENAGVIMPEVDFRRLSIPKYEPKELLEKLRELAAKGVFLGSALEIAVLKSRLSAFYYFKGGYALPVYFEPLRVEGLEDKNENSNGVKNDFGVPIRGPLEVDWLSSPTQTLSDNNVSRKRKQKSVAELMAENENIELGNRDRTEERRDFKKQKREENNNGALEGRNSQGALSTGGKRKVERNAGAVLGKRKEIEGVDGENIRVEANEELGMVATPRERKKSKYLSPPYTDLTWRIGNSSFKTESKVEHDKNTEARRDLFASQPVSEKLPNLDISVDTSPQTVENDKKMMFHVSDVGCPVNELLSEMQFAAVDPHYLREKVSLDLVRAFISALRSSTYLHGPNYKTYRKCKSSAEKKKVEVQNLPCLILTFAPECTLPSKKDIVRLFGKFGTLNIKKSKVVTDSNSIRIVFTKDSDAEAAFKSSLSENPFGSENVNCKLQCTSASSEPRNCNPKVLSPLERATDLISDASVIGRKVEIMTAILENYHSKFTPEDKSSLKDEMKLLLEKVETVSEKVRVMAENKSF